MLPWDRDFARVEVYEKRNYQYGYDPDHWREVIAKSCQDFVVYEMEKQHFLEFASLLTIITKRAKGTYGEDVKSKDNIIVNAYTTNQ